jgi:hypothetical protein
MGTKVAVARERLEIDQPTTYLEGPDRRVVFVFDPNFRTNKLATLSPQICEAGGIPSYNSCAASSGDAREGCLMFGEFRRCPQSRP